MKVPTTYEKRMGMMAVSTLVMLDAAATAVFVSKLGLEAEANPMMRSIIATHGFAGMFAAKLAGICLYWCVMHYHKSKHGHEYPLWPEYLIFAVMFPVCAVGMFLAIFAQV